MIQFYLSPYELREQHSKKIRNGFLLKVKTDHFNAGYADIHPWIEFGDPDIKKIPELLRAHKTDIEKINDNFSCQSLPSLLLNSIFFALRDGKARGADHFLNKDLSFENHFSLLNVESFNPSQLNDIIEAGFKRIKIKLGNNLKNEKIFLEKLCELLPSDILLRLDFNTKGDKVFLDEISNLNKKIEFIEDPFVDPKDWNGPWTYAYDQPPFQQNEVKVNWQIIKPAKQKWQGQSVENTKQIVFTSYLDHPVGIAHAFYEASLYGEQQTPYGFMTHNYYEENEFHQFIKVQGSRLSFAGQNGIGFDDILTKQKWFEI
jgi:hypothetical protein